MMGFTFLGFVALAALLALALGWWIGSRRSRSGDAAAGLARARTEVNEAKEQLALALDASRLALWDFDVASGRIHLSEAWSAMLGMARAPTSATSLELAALIPEEERAAVAAAIGAALKGPESSYCVEHRVTTTGGMIWIVSEGRVVSRTAQGRAVRMIGTSRDVSERVQAAGALRESEERFKGALENSAIGIAIVGLDGRWLTVNRALAGIVGYSAQELLALTFQDITHPGDLDADLKHVHELLAGSQQTYQMDKRYLRKDGREVWIQLNVSIVRDAAGQPLYFISQIQDISARRAAEDALRASEERFRGAMQSSPVGMSIASVDGRWLKVNPALCRIIGYSEKELLERTFQDVTHPEDLSIAPRRLRELLAGKIDTYQIEKRYLHKAGHAVWVQVNVSLMHAPDGAPFLISQIMDVGERRRLQEQIEHLALHDPLTDLPNSRLLRDRLTQGLGAALRAKRLLGVMYIDLDGFKPINDTYGHKAGDLVLKEVALRLKGILRAVDSVARVGGDEFVAILAELADATDATKAADRLLESMAVPFHVGENAVKLTASIGLALYPADGGDAETLLQHADMAMYAVKNAGKNAYRLFAPGCA